MTRLRDAGAIVIGKTNLDRALEAHPDHPFTVEWHPFQLNPDMPAGQADALAKRINTAAKSIPR